MAVVAHDAGAASLIFAWFESGRLSIEQCRFCLEGPAAKLFKIQRPNIEFFSLKDVLTNAKTLLTGTSWSSPLEHNARILGKKNSIKSIAVIDHWINYKERFIRDHKEVLPDEIWVCDKYAYVEAKRCFPNIEIINQKNDYIKAMVDEILSFKVDKHEDVTNVLYVLEPIRDAWAGDKVAGEFQALDFFINSIPSLKLRGRLSIILKPHPSDRENKYDHWVDSQVLRSIYIEKKQSLAKLLAWSDMVVGCETYAMVVALAVHKRVVSSLPRHAHNCRLPCDKIERLNQIKKN